MPEKTPVYRRGRAHQDFLCCLKEYFPKYSQIEDQILMRLYQQFEVKKRSFDDINGILNKPHRKATKLLKDLSAI